MSGKKPERHRAGVVRVVGDGVEGFAAGEIEVTVLALAMRHFSASEALRAASC